MILTENPLVSAQEFAEYCESVRLRLAEHIHNRQLFLDDARARLDLLESLARQADNPTILAELLEVRRNLEVESAALSVPTGETTTASSALLNLLDGSSHAVVRSPKPSSNGHSDDHENSDEGAEHRPKRSGPVVPPSTPARPLEDVYRDVEAMTALLDDPENRWPTSAGLVRLKAQLARQRGLQAELTSRGIDHWPLRQIMHNIRRRIDEEHGSGHYLIGLRAELWPSEPWPWVRLAELYEELADAVDAMAWYSSEHEKLSRPERHELLESIAAFQTRLWRHLQQFFPRQNDEHQIHLFRELCAVASQEDVYLFSLQERCSDELLAEKVDHLHILMEHLRLDRSTRPDRDAALQELKTVLRSADFGEHPDDVHRLMSAVEHCMDEGVPADSIAFRRWLTPYRELVLKSDSSAAAKLAVVLDTAHAVVPA